jgi:hypothetical protein
MPTIKNLSTADAFDIFEDGIQQLQVSICNFQTGYIVWLIFKFN